jgi:hypothetical protein
MPCPVGLATPQATARILRFGVVVVPWCYRIGPSTPVALGNRAEALPPKGTDLSQNESTNGNEDHQKDGNQLSHRRMSGRDSHAHSADAVPSEARSSRTTSEVLRASCIIACPPRRSAAASRRPRPSSPSASPSTSASSALPRMRWPRPWRRSPLPALDHLCPRLQPVREAPHREDQLGAGDDVLQAGVAITALLFT